MKTLYGDLLLTKGEGKMVDYELNNLEEKDILFLRRNIGNVFQNFKLLLDRTVYANKMFVLKATGWKKFIDINAKIEEVLDKFVIKDFEQII